MTKKVFFSFPPSITFYPINIKTTTTNKFHTRVNEGGVKKTVSTFQKEKEKKEREREFVVLKKMKKK